MHQRRIRDRSPERRAWPVLKIIAMPVLLIAVGLAVSGCTVVRFTRLPGTSIEPDLAQRITGDWHHDGSTIRIKRATEQPLRFTMSTVGAEDDGEDPTTFGAFRRVGDDLWLFTEHRDAGASAGAADGWGDPAYQLTGMVAWTENHAEMVLYPANVETLTDLAKRRPELATIEQKQRRVTTRGDGDQAKSIQITRVTFNAQSEDLTSALTELPTSVLFRVDQPVVASRR